MLSLLCYCSLLLRSRRRIKPDIVICSPFWSKTRQSRVSRSVLFKSYSKFKKEIDIIWLVCNWIWMCCHYCFITHQYDNATGLLVSKSKAERNFDEKQNKNQPTILITYWFIVCRIYIYGSIYTYVGRIGSGTSMNYMCLIGLDRGFEVKSSLDLGKEQKIHECSLRLQRTISFQNIYILKEHNIPERSLRLQVTILFQNIYIFQEHYS